MSHHLISFCLFIICLSHRGGHIKQVQDQTLEMSVHQHSRRERAVVDSASNVINTTLHVALEDGCLNIGVKSKNKVVYSKEVLSTFQTIH